VDHLTLTTKRTTLRPVGPGDVLTLHALWTDPEVRRYLWDDVSISEEHAAEVVAASGADFAAHAFGLWAIYDNVSAQLAGFCGFKPSEAGEPELLFGLWPRYWGRGLATEASRAVLSYAFDVLNCAQVVAATDVPNAASARTLERIGMQYERRGTLNGLDTFFYRLSRERFETLAASRAR
jgi:ribosomal-protein-alanine N-acetyltransferase